uniref:MAGE domain-containing protein n=1 Tax=Bos indicus x Bos taurus TaxID=30522 RepID=A0A4W2C3Q1_BOBOX
VSTCLPCEPPLLPPTSNSQEERPSSPSSAPQGSPPSSPAGDHQELQGAMAPSSPDAGPSCAASDEGVQGPKEESAGASQEAPATQSTHKDPLARKARILVEFLLEKYTKKEPITQNALMKIVSRKYRQHFSEILSTAREHMELVFGLEMKEVDRRGNIYTLISKVNLGGNNCPSDWGVASKSRLIMVLLGVIFMNGNCATENEIWEFLSMLGIYAGRSYWIFGEPRRLITKNLVQKEYLNYRRVPNSDPPRYEFLWGPRACVLAKFHGRVPSSFPDLYDEALRDQVERAGRRVVAMAEASAPSRAKSCSSSHI